MQTGLRGRNAPSLLLAAACLCFFAGCKKENEPAAPAKGNASGNPLTAPADYVGAVGKAQQSAQKTLGSVGLDQAIKTFHNQEGRLPKDLDELVAKGVINQVPPAPRGMKYEYDAKIGTIKVVPE